MQLIGSSGLLQYYFAYMQWHRYLKNVTLKENYSTAKQFSFNDLSYGFIIWLAACGVSIVAFFLETFWFLILNLRIMRDLSIENSRENILKLRSLVRKKVQMFKLSIKRRKRKQFNWRLKSLKNIRKI
jgi:hypothetical protein